MEKIKQYKYIIIIVLVILGFSFYWFQIRPVVIKKNCSWTNKVIPADTGITKEQAEANKKIYDNCIYSNWQCDIPSGLGRLGLENNSKERLPQPEKKITIVATEKEYDMCLRRNGL